MATDERSRHELYRKLEETIGRDPANTLMEYLPPVGWADVATKKDLVALEGRLDARFERIEARFERIEARFDDRFELVDQQVKTLEHTVMSAFRAEVLAAITAQTRAFVLATLGFLVTFSALLVVLRK